MIGGKQEKVNQKVKHADVIRETKGVERSDRITTKYVHIYGHHDKEIEFNNLSRPAQLNVICDTEAKRRLRDDIEQAAPRPEWVPEHSWTCKVGNK